VARRRIGRYAKRSFVAQRPATFCPQLPDIKQEETTSPQRRRIYNASALLIIHYPLTLTLVANPSTAHFLPIFILFCCCAMLYFEVAMFGCFFE